jgi:hypothetical protein
VESSSIVVLFIDTGAGNGTDFFTIGACDGLIRVKASGTLNHDARCAGRAVEGNVGGGGRLGSVAGV